MNNTMNMCASKKKHSYLDQYLEKHQKGRSSAAIAFLATLDHLNQTHPLVAEKIIAELQDQRSFLKMIASENFSSLASQLAMGNLLTDKYAEGYVYHRFYAGCEHIDALEKEAQELLKQIFRCEHAYVQPHSGADANLIAFWAILNKRVQDPELEKMGNKQLNTLTDAEYEALRQKLINQKLLGMSLNSGGHLTHGYRYNISSKFMKTSFYEVDPVTHLLDYAAVQKKAFEERPTILLAGYSAYTRKINFKFMKEIADSVNATLLVDMAHFAGLVAGGVFTDEYNPIPYADVITSTTHKTLRGPRGGIILCKDPYKEYIDKGCPMVMGGPLPHVIAAKCIAFKEALQPDFGQYAQQVVFNAKALAEELLVQNIPLLTHGTDNHMVIVDVQKYGLTGRQAENLLRRAYITCNRNAIPNDTNGPWYTSGIRLGAAALTTLGMGIEEFKLIGRTIAVLLKNAAPSLQENGALSRSHATIKEEILQAAQNQIQMLLAQFPLYPEIDLE